jgi:DNA repair protein RecO (recombination protein O)
VRHRTDTCQALLLRAVDYAEADRIVTLLTDRFGKLSLIARSARRSKKRFGAALQPLCLLDVELSGADVELGSLREARVARGFPGILGDLGRMGAGFAALELVRELTAERQADGEVFEVAVLLLAALDAERVPASRLLLCFEVRLLALLGFAPQLGECGLCGRRPAPGRAALFDPRHGHLVCRQCGGAAHRLGGELRMALLRAASPDWIGAAERELDEIEVRNAHHALRLFAEHRIGKALQADSLLHRSLR